MTFARAWILWLLPLAPGWIAWEWRQSARRRQVLLKGGMVLAVLLALAAPELNFRQARVAVAVLADTSASLSDADLAKENALLAQISGARGGNRVEVIPFARYPRALAAGESALRLRAAQGPDGRGTNLEAPIREALASLPAGLVHRIVLLTDGNENEGAVTRAAWQARQLGVPLDTIALAGRERPLIRTEAVGMPAAAFTGERFPVDLTISTPRAAEATVELAAEGKPIGSHRIALTAGENRVRIRIALNAAGAIDLSGRIAAAGLGESRFENAIAVRRPRVVWISGDPAGSDEHIAAVLGANKFDVASEHAVPADRDGTQLLVFNNVDLEALPAGDKKRVEAFVQSGGGALWIGGENNIYVDHQGAPEDPLARTFPAKLSPPKSPKGTTVVLIIDKSSSMEGTKIDLARRAAVGVVENLKPDDRIGVLDFDNSFEWVVPIRLADNKAAIAKAISGITPDGGTQIPPALADAYHKVLPLTAAFKHIVLLTDGISEEGDSFALSAEAARNHVTISTVGLGQDVNRTYLEKIAEAARGRSYFLTDPHGLEQILLKDVQEHTGTTAVEKPSRAAVKHASDLLDKVDAAAAPELLGYTRFEARPGADEILAVDSDPLLVRWQYGVGRAAIFASDAKSRWAANWVTWPGFDRLWTNIFRDLLPHGDASEAAARYDGANQDIVVEYRLSGGVAEAATPPDIFAIGPAVGQAVGPATGLATGQAIEQGGFRKPVELTRLAPGQYRGRVHIGAAEGLFRVRPLNESRAFPEVGLYRAETELAEFGSNAELLRSISAATGGRFNPSPGQVFDSGGRSMEATVRLWPWLLGLAVLLNLLELTLRKWRGITDTLRSAKREAPQAA